MEWIGVDGKLSPGGVRCRAPYALTVLMITMSGIIRFTFILAANIYSMSFFLNTAAMRSWSL